MTNPTIDTQLFYTLNGASGSSVQRLDLNSVTSTVIDLQSLYSTTAPLSDIVIDTASNLYFFGQQTVSLDTSLNQGTLSQPNVVQTFGVDPSVGHFNLAIDPRRARLYHHSRANPFNERLSLVCSSASV